MPFPNTDRVIYQENPLDQVICQVRFPAILKIDSEIPAIFQDKIRDEYPSFNDETELFLFNFRKGKNDSLQHEELDQLSDLSGNKNYCFVSEDNLWKVNLTRNALTLTTTKYKTWEEFKIKLEKVISPFVEIYKPNIFTRVGLRYVDVFNRSQLGLEKTDWDELINPTVLGLSATNIKNSIKTFENSYEIMLEDNESLVKLILKIVKSVKTGETCLMIDSDFFTNSKTSIDTVYSKLDYFNQRSGRLFRWCIKDKLHIAMKPKRI